jgi:acyl carrier protein
MTRNELMAVVIKIVTETVPELKTEDIDPNKSYRELDINSLDMVEIVNAAMRSTDVKVPVRELTKTNTINGLVDLLWRVSNESKAN